MEFKEGIVITENFSSIRSVLFDDIAACKLKIMVVLPIGFTEKNDRRHK